MSEKNAKVYNCPLEAAIDLIDGKWKCLILWHLNDKVLRFGELQRMMPAVTQKMLTQQLRDLERDGLLTRQAYAEIPPRVEYRLTELGRSLLPILTAMCVWGSAYLTARDQQAVCMASAAPIKCEKERSL